VAAAPLEIRRDVCSSFNSKSVEEIFPVEILICAQGTDRAGLGCLNSLLRFYKWIQSSLFMLPESVAAR
jgi:hypothetical protein